MNDEKDKQPVILIGLVDANYDNEPHEDELARFSTYEKMHQYIQAATLKKHVFDRKFKKKSLLYGYDRWTYTFSPIEPLPLDPKM